MRIRPLRKNEVTDAALIVGKNYSRQYELLARKELGDMFTRGGPRPVYFVAKEYGLIVGFAGYIQSWMDYSIYQIFWVNVHPAHQGEGVGKALMMRLIREVRKKKNAHLILLTADEQKGLPSYYSKNFGFNTLKKFGSHYHLMSLSLER